MRLVIEVSDVDRDALRMFLATIHPGVSYSALFRVLLRLAMDGTVPPVKLAAALAAPKSVLNVTLTATPPLVSNIALTAAPKAEEAPKAQKDMSPAEAADYAFRRWAEMGKKKKKK